MNIWIFNHYATNMFYDRAGRHHSIAKYLIKNGHDVSIFCANTIHGSNESVETGNNGFLCKTGADGVAYVFVKTTPYKDNGLDRIKNMYSFYRNLFKASKAYLELSAKPDVILASSVHPLTLVAGIKIAQKINVPCICEVRDLWPETLVELGLIKRDSIITRLMYKGERWIYKKADRLIFTMPGGKEYIKDRKWEKDVQLNKIECINNGVDLEKFDEDKNNFKIYDDDLENEKIFKVIYAGSIRKANKIDEFISLAEILKNKGNYNVKIIIYGDGDQRKRLEKECMIKKLDNIVFKGRVEKKYIPYILSKSDVNIVTDESNNLGKYGISWNKMFEYMASGKPVVVNYNLGNYNLVSDYGFGIAKEFKNIEAFYNSILYIAGLSKNEYEHYSLNARKAAEVYNYKSLACKLEKIFNGVLNNNGRENNDIN